MVWVSEHKFNDVPDDDRHIFYSKYFYCFGATEIFSLEL